MSLTLLVSFSCSNLSSGVLVPYSNTFKYFRVLLTMSFSSFLPIIYLLLFFNVYLLILRESEQVGEGAEREEREKKEVHLRMNPNQALH